MAFLLWCNSITPTVTLCSQGKSSGELLFNTNLNTFNKTYALKEIKNSKFNVTPHMQSYTQGIRNSVRTEHIMQRVETLESLTYMARN